MCVLPAPRGAPGHGRRTLDSADATLIIYIVAMAFAQTLSKFARSPQGKRVFREASRLAKDPRTRERIAESRKALLDDRAKRGKPAA